MAVAGESANIGSTVISQEQFGIALTKAGVDANASNFMSLLFNAFDKNGKDQVTPSHHLRPAGRRCTSGAVKP